jgi:cleavage stimulation factor subunit 3
MSRVRPCISMLTSDARGLFERTVAKLSPQAARPLFERFYRYECEYGDTAAIRKLSKRIADIYPEESTLSRFMQRHTLFGVNPIATYDLPPPLAPALSALPAPAAMDDDTRSIASSRANSIQPDPEERRPKDRRRQNRAKQGSPDPRTIKTKAQRQKELPGVIMELLTLLPPAHMFQGATFHVDELIKLIRNAGVPWPPGFVPNLKRAREDDDEGVSRRMKRTSG